VVGQQGHGVYNANAQLWLQHGVENTRCTRGGTSIVANRAECQERAVRAQHPFYHFREDNNKCGTSEHCDSPIIGTRRAWLVYAQPVATSAQSGAQPVLWKGNDGTGLVSTGNADNARSIQFIDLGAGAFESAGELRSVRFALVRQNQAGLKFQIYRPVRGNTYRLISETETLETTSNSRTRRPTVTLDLAQRLQFQAGDYIGWVHQGQGTFPFTGRSGGDVRWKRGIQSVGSNIDFDGQGNRVYGYEASYSPWATGFQGSR